MRSSTSSIARASRNPLLVNVYRQINKVRLHAQWDAMKEQILTPEVIREYHRQHSAIYQSILQRDAQRAQALISKHLAKARDDLLRANSRSWHELRASWGNRGAEPGVRTISGPVSEPLRWSRHNVLFVTLTGLILISAWLVLSGAEVRFAWPSLWLVAATGIFYALATLSLFAALSLGPLSIVAPIAGSYPALAVLFSLTQGARPGLVEWLAIVGGVRRRGPCLAERRTLRIERRDPARQAADDPAPIVRGKSRVRHWPDRGTNGGPDLWRCCDRVARPRLRASRNIADLAGAAEETATFAVAADADADGRDSMSRPCC